MHIEAGRHRFGTVAYDPERDLMELTIRGQWGVENGLTLDGDLWYLDPADPSVITGLTIRDAGRRHQAEGEIRVRLPSGDRVALRGAERALRAWRMPVPARRSRRPLRSPRS
jgi:hypothetical protein